MSQESLKAALTKTIGAIQENPAASRAVFRAETEWQKDVCCTARVRNFAPIAVDEPPELGGSDTAPNPVELLLVALGTCQEIVYAAYASVMDIPLSGVKVDVKGYLDLKGLFGMAPDTPPGFQRVTFDTKLSSPAHEDELRRLVEVVESRCPVFDTLTRAIEVKGKVSINGAVLQIAV